MKPLLTLALTLFASLQIHSQAVIHQFELIDSMNDFSVFVDGLKAPTYRCDVDMHKVQKASWCQFDMSKSVTVRVVNHNQERTRTVDIRPLSRKIIPEWINDSTIEFTLPRPEYLSIEFDGDRKHNLHLFAEPAETETYTGNEERCINWTAKNSQDVFIKNPKIMYFGPGVHLPKDQVMGQQTGDIRIPSNTIVYIAPGAVVRGKLLLDRVHNVKIIGRGIIYQAWRGVEIIHSHHVTVEGLTFINPIHYTVYGGQSHHITLRHLKSFSRHGWSDGIDMMSCHDVNIEDIFFRNSDDCIAIYNHRWWSWGNSHDYTIRRATLWADVAHPFNIGTHGDDRSKKGESITKVRVSDCDVLDEDGDGVFAIRCGDKNRISDIRFDNVRVEQIEKGRLFGLSVYFSDKYNRAPGNYVRDIHFSNISYTGDASVLQEDAISNYDDEHGVSDVHFSNIRINGVEVKKQDIPKK